MFGTFIIGSLLWALACLISFLVWEPLGPAVLLLGLIDGLAGLTIVDEGTAKAIMWFGGFKRAMMCWQGYEMDSDWDIKEKKDAKSSGLRWAGWWIFNWTQVYCYNLRWRDIQLGEGGERVREHEKVLDYLLVRPDVYVTTVVGAETGGGTKKPGGRMPIDVEFLVTLRSVNPHLTLFVGPSNWVENALARLNAMFSRWVAVKDIDYIQKVREDKDVDRLWGDLGNDPLTKILLGYGIKVEGMQIRSVGMKKEDEEAAKAEQTQRFQAKADEDETLGAVMEMIHEVTGKEIGALQTEFRKNLDRALVKYEKLIEKNIDLVRIKLAIKGKSFVDIRSGNAIMDLLAALRRMPGGEGGVGTSTDARVEEAKRIAREGFPPKT